MYRQPKFWQPAIRDDPNMQASKAGDRKGFKAAIQVFGPMAVSLITTPERTVLLLGFRDLILR